MFTGLVEDVGLVAKVIDEVLTQSSEAAVPVKQTRARTLTIESELIASDAELGCSISINGCCLTVTGIAGSQLSFEAGDETLSRTNLGQLVPDSQVNLERALKPDTRLGGHYVSGHVDALGSIISIETAGDWSDIRFKVPEQQAAQMAAKGSVAVDGISLTLVDVGTDWFSVALIPHTLEVTTMGQKTIGDAVNIETDILAKYVQRQLDNMSFESYGSRS